MKTRKYLPYIFLFLGIVSFIAFYKLESTNATDALAKNTIRFHVRANSDTKIDQAVKLKVKDAVVNYIYNQTKDFASAEETSLFITQHNDKIKNVAQKVIDENGFDYTVQSSFGTDSFPDKTYGDIIYPKGEYTSYTLTIGNGKGHNWWCVLYPPLCFVDTSTGVVPDSSKERLKESLTDTEYHTIVRYKFKYLTFLNELIPDE